MSCSRQPGTLVGCLLACLLLVDLPATAAPATTGPPVPPVPYGARLPDSTAEVALWGASSGWKIGRQWPVPEQAADAILIRAARNEAEAAQLVIRPAAPLHDLTLTVTELTGKRHGQKIGRAAVDLLRVRYVMIATPSDRSGTQGPWPDPLPPVAGPLALPAEQNQPIWIRVTVPKDAAAGIYTGSIGLQADGFSARVPLRVEVYDFALPDRMTCSTAFGVRTGNIFRYHGATDMADKRRVLDLYWRNFAAHHIAPYDPAPLDPIRVTWPDIAPAGSKDSAQDSSPAESLQVSFDFSAWDRAMAGAIDRDHFNSFRLAIAGLGGGTFHAIRQPSLRGFAEGTPEYQTLFQSYCGQIEAHLRAKGWLDEAFVYWFDEPAPKQYAFVKNGFLKLKRAAPGIRRMLTEQVEPQLVGGPNIWCPVTSGYNPAQAERRRAEGEQFWWYVCTSPKAPYAGLFIDHAGTEMRVWLWQTWQRQIAGILVWQTTYWTSSCAYPDAPQNPYDDPMAWRSGYDTPKGTRKPWGNGDGRFVYPPESCGTADPDRTQIAGPVDSIRWEMLRDGIEDYEYLAILRQRLAAGEGSPGADRELLAVPESISKDMKHFTKDPAPIEQRRHEIAQAIMRSAVKSGPTVRP